MTISLAQYDLMVQVVGTAQAEIYAAEAGGIDQTISGGGGTVVTDPVSGMLTVDQSNVNPDDFYSDGFDVEPPPAHIVPTPVPEPAFGLPSSITLESGERMVTTPIGDVQGTGGITQIAGLGGAAITGVSLTAAMALLRLAMRGATRVTAAHWGALPNWAKSLLVAAGIGIGFTVVQEIPGAGGGVPFIDILPGGGGPTPSEILGVSVVGSWTANGVRFYRLSDGKLAVQNKQGRWKVWKPKKPIVLYATGAADIPTLLRADGALNRQSKKIDKMLRRRAPKARTKSPAKPVGHHHGDGTTIVQN